MTSFPLQINSILLRTTKGFLKLKSWRLICGLGIGTGLICFSTNVKAAESISLRFESTQVTVPVDNLRNFVSTGEATNQNLQQFLQEHPKAQQALRNLLTKEVTLNPSTAKNFSSRPIGEFVLIQLDKFLKTPAQGEGLNNLRIALNSALEKDNSFSILELIERYPNTTINLDVSGLERAYQNISAFVERIQPALETVKATLQDLICDCPQTQQTQSSQQSSTPLTKELETGRPQCANAADPSNQTSLNKK